MTTHPGCTPLRLAAPSTPPRHVIRIVEADPSGRLWPDDVPDGGLYRSVFLPTQKSSVGQARAFTTAVLADWRVPGLIEDVHKCISELVTNVYQHTGSDEGLMVRVAFHLVNDCLSAYVRDRSSRPLVIRPQPKLDLTDVSGLSESGRGLHVVQAIATGWCWWRLKLPPGKVVACWFNTPTAGAVA